LFFFFFIFIIHTYRKKKEEKSFSKKNFLTNGQGSCMTYIHLLSHNECNHQNNNRHPPLHREESLHM